MSKLSRYLRNVPGHGPIAYLPDCHTAVEMKQPPVIVVQRISSTHGGPERRSIGLALQENGVRVEVAEINADELLGDLETARQWVEDVPEDSDGGMDGPDGY